jgi:bifunctional lysine-specific demethylase and histidyl-hydroxylase NO66
VGAGSPALTRLLGDDAAGFAAQSWGRRALLTRAAQRGGDDFADLFSTDAVDELLSRRGLRTPFIRMARNGTTLPESSYTTGGGVGAGIGDQVSDDKVMALFADGATIVLQALHRTWGPVVDLSQQLAADLGHPVQVNAYVTPPQSQGFSDHYDVHDVFVLQIHGAKRWAVREPVLQAPLRDQPWADRRAEVEAAAALPAHLQETFEPGDCLYLPRGFIHSAQALGGVSIHLTIGVHGWTRHHLAEALVDRARARLREDAGVRASLPVQPSGSLAEDVALARQALLRAVGDVPDEAVAAWLTGRARAAQRPEPVAPLAQLEAVQAVGAATLVRLRDHLMLETIPGDGDEVVVRSRAGRVRMPSRVCAVLEALEARGPSRVGDLDEDEHQAVETVRLLVRHGIVVADDVA